MTGDDIRAAAVWAIKHRVAGHEKLRRAAREVDAGRLEVPGTVGPKHPWSDVVLALYAVGVDVVGLKESRGT
jgi:hypothetical protein